MCFKEYSRDLQSNPQGVPKVWIHRHFSLYEIKDESFPACNKF